MINKKLLSFGLIGNALDHYDTALYIYLASILSGLFFKSADTTTALIKAYSVLAIQSISRPLGSIYFGKLADSVGPIKSLYYSLLGTAIATLCMGIMPIYDDIGIMAPILLIIIRFIQTFCGAGEHSVASMFVMANVDQKYRTVANAAFNSSTFIGMSAASIAAYFVASSDNPEANWRIPYIIGILTALFGLVLRYQMFQSNSSIKRQTHYYSDNQTIPNLPYQIIALVALIYVFTMITYYIPFVFWNDFIPLIQTKIKKTDMLGNTTLFLYYNIALIFLCGFVFRKTNYKKILIICLLIMLVYLIPAFVILKNVSIVIIEIVRAIMISIGVTFSIISSAYIYQICESRKLYSYYSYGLMIGQLLGTSTLSLCLWLWHTSGLVIAPAVYISLICVILIILLVLHKNKNTATAKL